VLIFASGYCTRLLGLFLFGPVTQVGEEVRFSPERFFLPTFLSGSLSFQVRCVFAATDVAGPLLYASGFLP